MADPGFQKGGFKLVGKAHLPQRGSATLAAGVALLGGSGGMPPRKIMKNGCSEVQSGAFWVSFRVIPNRYTGLTTMPLVGSFSSLMHIARTTPTSYNSIYSARENYVYYALEIPHLMRMLRCESLVEP